MRETTGTAPDVERVVAGPDAGGRDQRGRQLRPVTPDVPVVDSGVDLERHGVIIAGAPRHRLGA